MLFFYILDSWLVCEDCLSIFLIVIFDEKNRKIYFVIWLDNMVLDVLIIYKEGEVILFGKIFIGYIGFENFLGIVFLFFGFFYKEVFKIYICKLILVFLVEVY